MKKFLYLASATTLTLASYTDEFNLGNSNGMAGGKTQITANFQMGVNTRLSLTPGKDENGTPVYDYEWNTGNAIGIFGQYLNNGMFWFNGTIPSTVGTFAGQTSIGEG